MRSSPAVTVRSPGKTFPLKRLTAGLLLSLLLALPALAQSHPAAYAEKGRFYAQHFSPEAYGGHAQNWAVVQDRRGVIYVANTSGVLEYDGVRWRMIGIPNESVAYSLALGKDGRVYVGAQGEIGFLAPDSAGSTRYVSLLDHVPPEDRDFANVWKTLATSEGVYFQSPSRLFRWDGRHMDVWRPEHAFHLGFVVRDRLYVRAWKRGLMTMEADSLRLVPGGAAFADERVYVMLPHGEADVLVGTRTRGLFRYDGQAFTPLTTEADAFLLQNQLYSGAVLPGGALALTTMRGGAVLLSPSGRRLRVLDEAAGLPSNAVVAAAVDREGGLWLGTWNGLSRVEVASPLSFYDKTTGLSGTLQALARHRGRMYAATSDGVYVLEPATDVQDARFRSVPGLKAHCLALLPTPNGLLAGCVGGAYQVDPERAAPVWAGQTVTALQRARRDAALVYAGLSDGLALLRLQDGTWAGTRVEGVGAEVRSIEEDRDGAVWLGTTYAGALRLRFRPDASAPPTVTHFGREHGLPPDAIGVAALEGRVVLGTAQGLYRFVGADVTSHAGADTLFVPDSTLGTPFADGSRDVFRMVEAASGDVWMRSAGETGVVRTSAEGAPDWDAAPFRRARPPIVYALYPETDGVWAGGNSRLLRYDASAAKRRASDPARGAGQAVRALVRRVSTIGGDSLLFGGFGEEGALASPLRYEHNALRFAYALPSYDDVRANRFRHRLDGFDEAWSGWTDETRKDYTNLPEGRYVFRVQAVNAHGSESGEGAFAFTILPPWYRTWWAYGLLGAGLFGLVGGAAYGFYRHRTRRLKEQNAVLERHVAERTRALLDQKRVLERQKQTLERANLELKERDEQQSEVLGVAAHDLKNPLSGMIESLKVLVEDARQLSPTSFRDLALEFLPLLHSDAERMLHIIRKLLDAQVIGDGKVTLKKERVDVARLVEAAVRWNVPRATKKDIPLHADLAEGCHAWLDETQMQRVLDNLISNAVKFSPPGRAVRVSLTCQEESLRIAVADDGPGLTEEDKRKLFGKLERLSAKPTGGESSTGLGLYIVKTLVELHEGRVEVESEYGSGTTFTVVIPADVPAWA